MKLRSQNYPAKRRLIVVVLVVLIVVATLASRDWVFRVLSPIQKPLAATGAWITQTAFWWLEAPQINTDDLQALYAQRDAFAIEQAQLQELRDENAQLKSALSYVERVSIEYLAASVLSRSVSNTITRFTINVGANDGVEIGAAVIVEDGILLGKVISVGEHISTVSGLTDTSAATAVTLLNESRTIGLAEGSTGDLITISFIPADEIIKENNLVITSGLDAPIPSGLVVGVINAVLDDLTSPFQKAIVEPLIDVRRISTVIVLTDAAL